MLNIFISDLTLYNAGQLTGQWHDLETEEGRQSAMDAVSEITDKGHEHFITDYETEYLKIGEYHCIESLCEAGEIFEDNPADLVEMVGDINAENGWYEHLDAYDMEDFNIIMDGFTAEEVALKVYYGDFNPTDEFFIFNDYENLESLTIYDYREMLENEGADIVEDWLYLIHHITA